MLGACIASTNLSVEQFSLTIKFKENMERVMKLVADNDKNNTDGEFNTIINQLTSLKTGFLEWTKNRRINKMS